MQRAVPAPEQNAGTSSEHSHLQAGPATVSDLIEVKAQPPDPAADPLAALLQQARHGNFAAFETLVERLQPRVFRLAHRIVGHIQDAEDITQQTFLSVLENLDTFRGESRVETWVLRIATNHALKALRKRRGLPTLPLELPDDSEDPGASLPHPDFIAQWRDNPENLVQQRATRELLEKAIRELEEKYRLVFLLRDVEGLTVQETAEMLGITESNVKVRLLRARLWLRELLTRAFGDESTRVVADHKHE